MSDKTTEMILDTLAELLRNEPPQDAGGHPSREVHERVGAEWAQWDEQVAAFYMLAGPRLVNDALRERGISR